MSTRAAVHVIKDGTIYSTGVLSGDMGPNQLNGKFFLDEIRRMMIIGKEDNLIEYKMLLARLLMEKFPYHNPNVFVNIDSLTAEGEDYTLVTEDYSPEAADFNYYLNISEYGSVIIMDGDPCQNVHRLIPLRLIITHNNLAHGFLTNDSIALIKREYTVIVRKKEVTDYTYYVSAANEEEALEAIEIEGDADSRQLESEVISCVVKRGQPCLP